MNRFQTPAKIFFFLCILGYGFPAQTPAFSSPETPQKPAYKIFRGVSHVHTQYSHDSNAPLGLVIEKAKEMDLDFVVVADHNSMKGAEAYRRMKIAGHRPLLIFGDEVSTRDGHLIALGIPNAPPMEGRMDPQELIDWIHQEGGYAILAHPLGSKNPWRNWEAKGWDGLEIYNFGHELFSENIVEAAIDSFSDDPADLLNSAQRIVPEHFSFWDNLLKERPVVATAGSDAHLKRSTKNFFTALQASTVYVMAGELKEEEIVKAIGSGRVFIVFETRGMAREFSFWAERNGEAFNPGETLQAPAAEVSLHIRIPPAGRIRLIHDGSVVAEEEAGRLEFSAQSSGAYRVEVYQNGNLWIVSNPIYLKDQGETAPAQDH